MEYQFKDNLMEIHMLLSLFPCNSFLSLSFYCLKFSFSLPFIYLSFNLSFSSFLISSNFIFFLFFFLIRFSQHFPYKGFDLHISLPSFLFSFQHLSLSLFPFMYTEAISHDFCIHNSMKIRGEERDEKWCRC